MAIVTTVTTVSVSYYTKRGKDFTLSSIDDLRRLTNLPPLTSVERAILKKKYASELAWEALRLHALLPE